MSKPQFTHKEKQQHLDDWRVSGLTKLQYCQQHQLNYQSFSDWPRALAGRKRTHHKIPSVIPVNIVAEHALSDTSVTIIFNDKYAIRCLPAQLPSVLKALAVC